MGNCLVLHENVIKIMKSDGKILEYRAPVKVEQVLSEFSNHAISDRLPVLRHLLPDTKLVRGQLYYLIPLPLQLQEAETRKKKKVRFANPEVEAEQESGVVRIKLVIRKKELQEILQKGGVSVEKLLSQSENVNEDDTSRGGEDFTQRQLMLESIPEVN